MGKIQNFVKYVLFLARYTMATDLSQGKTQEFVGQRLKRNNISIFKSVFKGMF